MQDIDPRKVWRQKSGELVLIRHMTDRHLSNALRMCEREIDTKRVGNQPISEERVQRRKRARSILFAEFLRRKAEAPLPGELAARLQREMEEIMYDASQSSSPPPTSPASSKPSTDSSQSS